MKKIVTIISSALLLAGVAHAQDTIELSSAQMDQVNAGFAASSLAGSFGIFEGFNAVSGGGGTISNSEAGTTTNSDEGFAAAFGFADNITMAFSVGGSLEVLSNSGASAAVSTP